MSIKVTHDSNDIMVSCLQKDNEFHYPTLSVMKTEKDDNPYSEVKQKVETHPTKHKKSKKGKNKAANC